MNDLQFAFAFGISVGLCLGFLTLTLAVWLSDRNKKRARNKRP